jgi:hypothetical protein
MAGVLEHAELGVPQQAVQDALVLRLDDGSSSPASIKVGCLISGARGNVEKVLAARSWKMYPGQLGG